jgi:predicted permease
VFVILCACAVLLYIGIEKDKTVLWVIGLIGAMASILTLIVLGFTLAKKLTLSLTKDQQ